MSIEVRLDVRPILASGRDPFSTVMQAAEGVPANGVMIVVAPFDPVPLRRVLATSGFSSDAVARGPGEWEITFRRDSSETAMPPAVAGRPERLAARVWNDQGETHVDVRGLDSGIAVQAVLEALDAAPTGHTLIAHLDRNIDALYPELARRRREAAFVPGERAEVRLEIAPLR